MAGIRPLRPTDLPRLVQLHRRGFPGSRPADELEVFLRDLFFGHPWRDDGIRSVGWVDGSGRLMGCLGAMPRPMILDGRPVRAVVSHNFLVDPDARRSFAAIQLVRAMLSMGQEITFSESNGNARTICERLGWTTLHGRSRRWIRPLRPAAFGLHLLGRRVGWADRLRPLGALPDAAAARTPGFRWRVPRPKGSLGPLDAELLVGLIARASRVSRLRPCYEGDELRWMFEVLGRSRRSQRLRGRVLLSPAGAPEGWFLYQSRPGAIGRVLQVGTVGAPRGAVLDHLFHDAWHEGNVAVSGLGDPEWDADLRAKACTYRTGRTWVIAYSGSEAARRAVAEDSMYVSRLEAEGWILHAF
jgi:hypothetical protein